MWVALVVPLLVLLFPLALQRIEESVRVTVPRRPVPVVPQSRRRLAVVPHRA